MEQIGLLCLESHRRWALGPTNIARARHYTVFSRTGGSRLHAWALGEGADLGASATDPKSRIRCTVTFLRSTWFWVALVAHPLGGCGSSDSSCGFGAACDAANSSTDPCTGVVCTACNRCEGGVCVAVEDGGPCIDGTFCTVNEVCRAGVCASEPRDCAHLTSACVTGVCDESSRACVGRSDPALDSDLDGVCNDVDRCPGGDDGLDDDQDRIPNACETCPGYDEGLGLSLKWPLAGKISEDWIVSNYLDHDDRADELSDHTGNQGDAARTYDGHNGVDVSLANFRLMDSEIPVFAVAAGTVERTADGHQDRNISRFNCPPSNFVDVRQDNGFLIRYLHFKKGSVMVQEGARVLQGQLLALVGSSGCSTWPHLHLEIRDCDHEVVDPFIEGLWAEAPPYEAPLGLMDVVINEGGFTAIEQMRDPLPNVTDFRVGETIGIGLVMGGGVPKDEVSFALVDPGGSRFASGAVTYEKHYRRAFWWWNRSLSNASPGAWRVEIYQNGVEVRRVAFVIKR